MLAQGFSFNVLSGDEVQRVSLPYVIDCKDVGVVQGGGGAGFLLETAQPVFIPGVLASQQLERDPTTKPRILSQEHFAHATAPDMAENTIVADLLAYD